MVLSGLELLKEMEKLFQLIQNLLYKLMKSLKRLLVNFVIVLVSIYNLVLQLPTHLLKMQLILMLQPQLLLQKLQKLQKLQHLKQLQKCQL